MKERSYIVVMQNNVPIGYVKSVSYVNGTFKITKNKCDAKGYTKLDKLQGDIDTCAVYALNNGMMLIYD